jgi:hypothetical protein
MATSQESGGPDGMKHAGRRTLTTLEPVLRALREHPVLVEKSPGAFYVKSKAFLHFHEDPAGLFADVKEDLLTFARYRVSTRAEQKELLARVKRCLSGLVMRVSAPAKRGPHPGRTPAGGRGAPSHPAPSTPSTSRGTPSQNR